MAPVKKFLPAFALLSLALFFACGGGKSDPPPPPPPPVSVAPTISVQPTNQLVTGGWAATFTVTASGTPLPNYQWHKGGTAIPGATGTSYITPPTVPADNGASFTVTVSNAAGSITSSPAVLTVQSLSPAILTQPAHQTVVAGTSATFTVKAAGTAPLSYQWSKGASAITGATSATYTTPVTVLGDSGSSYTVTITNATGSVTSAVAVLTVQSLATQLDYTDPTAGDYRLMKNTGLSTATHLVLDLVGPTTGATGSGVTATFTADAAKVSWVNVAAGDAANTFVQNGTAFTLGTAPVILKGKVTGGVLQAAVAQKGVGIPPVSLNATLLRVAMDLRASQPVGAVTFSADNTKCQVLDGAGAITGITVSVGTLNAQ